MIRNLLVLIICCCFMQVAIGQRPFVCRGEYYLTLRPSNPPGEFNSLYTVNIDPNTQRVTFREVPGFDDTYHLNAMGYRVTDNYIYIVEQDERNSLLRIDGNGQITRLREMTELPNLRYYAAACTADGKYLVLSASPSSFGFGTVNINLVFIDLEDPSYPTRIMELDNNRYLFFDMAFDPFTGICYGYDSNERTLVRIDINSGEVEPVGRAGQISTAMGALFFDSFGNLYGYGSAIGNDDQNTLFSIDKNSGEVNIRTRGEPADRSDGCACPYTLQLTKDVYPRETIPCGEVYYTFVVGNASAVVRDGLTFRDVMPEDFEILEIVRNPYGGDVIDTGKDNELLIRNMDIPLGVDSIIVKVRVGENSSGIYKNQAMIDNLPESLGGSTISDDPTTIPVGDSTTLYVLPLTVNYSSRNYLICEGESVTLRGERPDVTYLWQDEFETDEFVITEPGTYWVEARSLCEIVYDTIEVQQAPPLSVEVGMDHSIRLGDSFDIDPFIEGAGPFQYQWFTSNAEETIECANCPSTTVTPFNDGTYTLQVRDGAGCIESDTFQVEVDRSVHIWIPNAFTPNFDGVNDYFYVLGRYPYHISNFEIYDRWGQRLFHNQDILVNDEFAGWNGFAGGEPLMPGVYVYRAELSFVDGTKKQYVGDVTLVK